MNSVWVISILIILLTILIIIYLHGNNINIKNEYKYLASSIGISGFIFAIMADGIFIK